MPGHEPTAVPEPLGREHFRLIADCAPVPMWLTALDRRRSFVNSAYADFLGVSYADALVLDWRSIIHPDDAAALVAASIAGEASLQPFTLEARYRRHDGEWRWLHSVSRPSWDEAGAHNGFIGVAFDITESKRAEIALREREAQLSAFIGQTTAGFAQVDLEGRFTLVNDRFCEIAGQGREALLGITMQSITHPDDLPRNVPMFEAAVREGTPYTHDKRYVRPDGSLVWVNNSVAVIRRESGEPYGVLAVTIDVSERHAAEERQRLLIDELNHRVKNTLAIIQAIAEQSFGGDRAEPDALDGFRGRLGALAAAHNLLTRDGWSPAPLSEVVRSAVAAHCGEDERVSITGSELTLQPKTAVTMALAIHELATNATKHGALSNDAGTISIAWRVEPVGDVHRLDLSWVERGGPPVPPPGRRGFGTRMIERGLASELSGTVRLHFEPEGVRCEVSAELASAA